MQSPSLPKHIQALFLIFFIANLTHFIHNAEHIAFYPGIPAWLTREKVYLAWLSGVSVGLACRCCLHQLWYWAKASPNS